MTALPPGATDRATPPTGWHVHVLPSGRTMPYASDPSVWHRYAALYGPYPWRVATPEEITQAEAEISMDGPEMMPTEIR